MDKRATLLARRIERERQSVRAQLRLLNASRASVSDIKEQEMRAYERLTFQIKTLDRAWESLQRGTYGICRQCEQHIPNRRLEAMPGAVFCVPCQATREEAVPGVLTR